ncbi:hypothetical protein LEP1GSC013_4341 [Leptospira interrogans serovar Valbuzzi str. Duyster]|nr:hypothetical protein LEP1GSC013_4341 [Leptospira interrogans serovar Valbuzzi str. Duyster]ENO70250.1 hypothetical protein LEP1GSC012_4048 [Leptospira interrogans serovar Valbuzzi str. Valbuzzi]
MKSRQSAVLSIVDRKEAPMNFKKTYLLFTLKMGNYLQNYKRIYSDFCIF